MDVTSFDIGLIIATLLCLSFAALWIIALIRVIKNEFPGQNEKLIWALLIIFLPFIGTIVYFVVGKAREIKN
jgi:hypothetical protein